VLRYHDYDQLCTIVQVIRSISQSRCSSTWIDAFCKPSGRHKPQMSLMIGKTCTRCMLPPLGYSQRMPCCGSLGHLRFSQVRNLGHQLQPLRCGGPTTLPHLDLRETGHAASRCPICGYERICMAESKSQSRSRLRHPAEIPMRSVMICDP